MSNEAVEKPSRIAPIEAGHKIQLPAEWASDLGMGGVVLLEKTESGILVRLCHPVSWDAIFAKKLSMAAGAIFVAPVDLSTVLAAVNLADTLGIDLTDAVLLYRVQVQRDGRLGDCLNLHALQIGNRPPLRVDKVVQLRLQFAMATQLALERILACEGILSVALRRNPELRLLGLHDNASTL